MKGKRIILYVAVLLTLQYVVSDYLLDRLINLIHFRTGLPPLARGLGFYLLPFLVFMVIGYQERIRTWAHAAVVFVFWTAAQVLFFQAKLSGIGGKPQSTGEFIRVPTAELPVLLLLAMFGTLLGAYLAVRRLACERGADLATAP